MNFWTTEVTYGVKRVISSLCNIHYWVSSKI